MIVHTGAWVNQGLGTVQMESRHLVWVYTAPRLDYWIAAPFPSSSGKNYYPDICTAEESWLLWFWI